MVDQKTSRACFNFWSLLILGTTKKYFSRFYIEKQTIVNDNKQKWVTIFHYEGSFQNS